MIKYYKYSIYKIYNDELWGYLINNTNYSKIKNKLLLQLQFYLKKNYFYKNKKWIRYKKYKFIKKIKNFNFAFIFYNKRRLWWIRLKLKKIFNLKKKKRFKNFKFIKFFYNFFFIKRNFNFNFKFVNIFNFYKKKQNILSKIYIYKNRFYFFKIQNFFNFIKKIFFKFKFYKIKRKLKKILKVDMKFEKQFFYNVHIIKPRPKIKKKKNDLKKKPFKLLALFFGFKNIKKFKKLLKRKVIKKYLMSNKFNDFLYFLESRLETFLFRNNFFYSIYFIKQFIYSKNIFVNNMIIFRPDYKLNLFDIVNINYKYFKWLFKNIKYKLKNKLIFINIPNYILVDWALLISQLIKKPLLKQINKPFKFSKYYFI